MNNPLYHFYDFLSTQYKPLSEVIVMSCPRTCPKWSNIALTGAVEDFSISWSTDVLENAFISNVYSFFNFFFLSIVEHYSHSTFLIFLALGRVLFTSPPLGRVPDS